MTRPYRTGTIHISTDRFGRYTYTATLNGRSFSERCYLSTTYSQALSYAETWIDGALS